MKTCFFMGHRDAPDEVEACLRERVVQAITQDGVTDFVVGFYGNFDRMAAQAVRIAKKRYPFVTLTLLRPYHPAQRPISLPEGFDASLYPPGMERVPPRLAILRANQYMVGKADVLLLYSCHPGNTASFLELARRRAQIGALVVENLAKKDDGGQLGVVP